MNKARKMKKRSVAYEIKNAFCDALRHSWAMVACGSGSVKLVLNQAAFAFGAFDGAPEDPE